MYGSYKPIASYVNLKYKNKHFVESMDAGIINRFAFSQRIWKEKYNVMSIY